MKKPNQTNPFVGLVLDQEEQMLEDALESGEFVEVIGSELEKSKQMLREAATQYLELNTSKPVTIRINQLDLIKVKAKAKAHNIPYQTLLGSLIHQYADGEKRIVL